MTSHDKVSSNSVITLPVKAETFVITLLTRSSFAPNDNFFSRAEQLKVQPFKKEKNDQTYFVSLLMALQ
jgi:hypothetical protein